MAYCENFNVENYLVTFDQMEQMFKSYNNQENQDSSQISQNSKSVLLSQFDDLELDSIDQPQKIKFDNNPRLINHQEYLELFQCYKKNSKIKQGLYEGIMKILAPENAKLIQKRYQKKCWKDTCIKAKGRLKPKPKVYTEHSNGRKNITKNIGSLLRNYFMRFSAQEEVASNSLIQNFINNQGNKQVNYSLKSLKELKNDLLASQLASRYLSGLDPLLDLMSSNKIADKKWYVQHLRGFTLIMKS